MDAKLLKISAEYKIFSVMIRRCIQPKNRNFHTDEHESPNFPFSRVWRKSENFSDSRLILDPISMRFLTIFSRMRGYSKTPRIRTTIWAVQSDLVLL